MAEHGGTSTQSGIFYQNSVAALFLGRLCDPTERLASEVVVNVRVEAPQHVDDIVVTFADSHKTYIQAKENIRVGDEAWEKLWSDFENQFLSVDFARGRDRLLFHTGEIRSEFLVLREMCKRAAGLENHSEWITALNTQQASLLRKIQANLDPARAGAGDASLFELLRHVDVEIWGLDHIERDLSPIWMPDSNKRRRELFRLLRDKAGGQARYRKSFSRDQLIAELAEEATVSFSSQPNIGELRALVTMAGAVLRQHKHNFAGTGIHIDQPTVDEIVEWVVTSGDHQNVAVILDQPGMGKTVVARDTLLKLESNGVAVLALKADQQLSSVNSRDDLQLGLPDSVERVMARLAEGNRAVLLIDQIDALSLSIARDQKALNLVLDLIARVRLIPNVRVLLSCRLFDLNNDPRLKGIEIPKKFKIAELTDDVVKVVLERLGMDFQRLTPTTKLLLRIPLHLELFARAIEAGTSLAGQNEPSGVSSLQDLYSLIWKNVISAPDGPPLAERERVINLITEYMYTEQKPSAPQSIFSTSENVVLESAVTWLASHGILIAGNKEWSFLHQTFFDFSYAKRFVEQGNSISTEVLGGDQGLSARPQVMHVLGYLRSTNPQSYLRELHVLLNSSELRVHLRTLVLQWFGGLTDPTDDELLVARRMLAVATSRPLMLGAIRGNVGWFNRLRIDVIPGMLDEGDQALDTQIIPYLSSLIEEEQSDVINLVRPFLGRSEQWNRRLWSLLDHIHNWQVPQVTKLFEELFHQMPRTDLLAIRHFDDIAKIDPKVGCRLIQSVFYFLLNNIRGTETGEQPVYVYSIHHELEQLNGSTLVEALSILVHSDPDYFLEVMLPWLEETLELSYPSSNENGQYRSDVLSHSWYASTFVVKRTLLSSLTDALVAVARTKPEVFRPIATRLAATEFETNQLLLSHVYRTVPELYAEDALEFLLTDSRRLNLGSDGQYDTRQIIHAICPYLSYDQQVALEEAIFAYRPLIRDWGLNGLKRYCVEEFRLLRSVPNSYLSEKGKHRLQELERKFPNEVVPEHPIVSQGGFVGPPIDQEAIEKMSDAAWLGAMTKYHGNVAHRDFLKGGATELARELARRVKEEPERFYHLAMRAPADIDSRYVHAFIGGLAESAAPLDYLVAVIRRFVPQEERDMRSAISSALEKRASAAISDDLVDLLESYARGPMEEQSEEFWRVSDRDRNLSERHDGLNSGPYISYLNSPRGSAFRALMRALDERGDVQSNERKWSLIEFAANDPSSALRAGAIEELTYLLHQDRERAIALFERLMDGHPELLQVYYTQEFLRYGLFRYYRRMRPFILAVTEAEFESTQQRGAELICIAAISHGALSADELSDAQQLAETVITGRASWRRGAARIYAFNVASPSSDICVAGLIRLLDDDDETVRRFVSGTFSHLRDEHIYTLRTFLEAFASSRSLDQGWEQFTEFLWTHATLDPEWALRIVSLVLQSSHQPTGWRQFDAGEELIRLVLRIYTDPISTEQMRRTAMDLFDQLMQRYAFEAHRVLSEWDTR